MALFFRLLCLATAFAGSWSLDQAGFAAARGQGRKILLHLGAEDCGVCAEQEKLLARLLGGEPSYKELAVFRADVEAEREALLKLGIAAGRSTLILFEGEREAARGVSIATEEELRRFLRTLFPQRRRGRPAKPRPSNRLKPRP